MGIYEELQERGLIAQVTDEKEIRDLVNNGKAVFYIGFDPTADSLHVGHFMTLVLMKRLQMAGNRPIALVGGGTGMIGDPSGKTDMRKVLTVEDIDHNCACFKKQMERFIEFGPGKAQLVNNADWIRNLNYIDLMRDVGACFSVNKMLAAECYKQRMERGLTFLEFNYMIMQSYDFYYLHEHYGCNMQFGGDDQWSNMLGGTELIRKKTGKDAFALTITLLTNSEGKKMGKKCVKLLTFIPMDEIRQMEAWEDNRINEKKEILAFELTKMVHGEEEAIKAQAAARALFSGEGDDTNMPTTEIENYPDEGDQLLNILVKAGLTTSRGEGRRLIEQGGLSVNGEKVTDPNVVISKKDLTDGIKIKKGKKVFHKVIAK